MANLSARACHRFLVFGIVGTSGFLVDAAIVFVLTHVGMGALPAQAMAFAVAVTITWLGNRFWTFRDRAGRLSLSREWARYVSANTVGWLVNNGVYTLLVLLVPFVAREPVWAVAAGSLAGLAFNYNAARRVVFA